MIQIEHFSELSQNCPSVHNKIFQGTVLSHLPEQDCTPNPCTFLGPLQTLKVPNRLLSAQCPSVHYQNSCQERRGSSQPTSYIPVPCCSLEKLVHVWLTYHFKRTNILLYICLTLTVRLYSLYKHRRTLNIQDVTFDGLLQTIRDYQSS